NAGGIEDGLEPGYQLKRARIGLIEVLEAVANRGRRRNNAQMTARRMREGAPVRDQLGIDLIAPQQGDPASTVRDEVRAGLDHASRKLTGKCCDASSDRLKWRCQIANRFVHLERRLAVEKVRARSEQRRDALALVLELGSDPCEARHHT